LLPNFFARCEFWAQEADLMLQIVCSFSHGHDVWVRVGSGWCVPPVLELGPADAAPPAVAGSELGRLADALELGAAIERLGAHSIEVGFDGCWVSKPRSLGPAVEFVRGVTRVMRSLPLMRPASDRGV
jgi:hypothetical protein